MALNLLNLDEKSRLLMLQEVDSDFKDEKLYISSRLSLRGKQDYLHLLKEAISIYDDSWLANQLRNGGRINIEEQRKKPKGGYTIARIPDNAPEMLAEGEFNRFYMRAICLRAIEEELEVEVYRAIIVSNPRPQSEAKIGTKIDPNELLNDLRQNIGANSALKLPPGPNSGLTIRLIS